MTDYAALYLTWAHLIAALLALGLGILQLLRNPKGDATHKSLGRGWVVLMLIVTIPSFWMRSLEEGSFSWIHGLSVWVLFCLFMAIWNIRKGNVRRHAAFMMGTLIGVAMAGLFAILPGRFISELLNYATP
ncbi:MAG: DUF2306 domain-containing protein [Sneathiella sp.]|uniref:DUF2306 domain-containing protein n=1 Tax=Sneathiella sp. TaxID=1964365 RepID=UPI003002F1B1